MASRFSELPREINYWNGWRDSQANQCYHIYIYIYACVCALKVKLAIVVEWRDSQANPCNHIYINIYICVCVCVESKVGDRCRSRPEASLFNSYNIEVFGRALLFPYIAPLYPWYITYNAVLCNEASSTIFVSLVWHSLGWNPGLPGHRQTLYPQFKWVHTYIVSIKIILC